METIVDAFSTSLVVREGSEGSEGVKKELTEDLIVEILARLPVKSLLRFKSVSKRWYSLILSPNFVAIHSAHSHRKKKVSLLFYSCKNNDTRKAAPRHPKTFVSLGVGDVTERLTFYGNIGYVEIVGCFNGVVCLSLSKRPQKYALWNPATKQLREFDGCKMDVPDRCNLTVIDHGWYGSGFCFDPVTNAFKVAQVRLIVTKAGETMAQVNVFSTATNSWTGKNIHVPYRIGGFNFNHRCASFVNGYMHWHVAILQDDNTLENNGAVSFDLEDMYILSYNMTDEVFQRIEVTFPPAFVYYHLAAYKGDLAILVHKRTASHSSCNEVDVWVLNDCGGANQSWSKVLTCTPSIKVRFAVGFFRKDDIDLLLLGKESSSSSYVYDPENGETKKFWKKYQGSHTFLYSESLASLN